MNKLLLVLLSTLLLASCTLPLTSPEQPPAPVTPAKPEQKKEPPAKPAEKVSQPPKIQTTNWNSIVQPLIAPIVKARGVEAGKVLFIETVKNNTNGSLKTFQATDAIIDAINNKRFFQIVPKKQVYNARQALGLSSEDSLISRSKAIGLGRYLSADYVLYSVVFERDGKRRIEMQLMLTKTGEILWSNRSDINQ
ncbi:MAG: penicillin-binding protein activator LpoB [Enterobacteriaceae bacterium]|jgi:uncharacterized protein (TIGR02722 family)|nr:penicillin-binding protein activator LpoB [Enterobacteriaceae bacterium]